MSSLAKQIETKSKRHEINYSVEMCALYVDKKDVAVAVGGGGSVGVFVFVVVVVVVAVGSSRRQGIDLGIQGVSEGRWRTQKRFCHRDYHVSLPLKKIL